jgi:hypothetical protein
MKRSTALARRSTSAVLAAAAIGLCGVGIASPASAHNRVTPGSFTGYGFDQCVAPSQAAMDGWLTTSHYWAIGIYISGDSRACANQPSLTPAWISTQLRNGWRLLPLTVGPQAACSDRSSYRRDARISADPSGRYKEARTQGRREAATTVRAARALGISAKSTLWYDLEAFSIAGTRCRESAISFLSGWSRNLHRLGYVSGVYSSAASGIKMLDEVADSPGRYTMPDRVWIADWNGKADVYSAYVRPTTWMPHRRVHQYLGGHAETHGGVTITVDSNFMSLGRGSVAPRAPLACGVGIDLPRYPRLHRGDHGREVKALHCLLKRKGDYRGRMHGQFKGRTYRAVAGYQEAHGIRADGVVTRRTWTTLVAGGSAPILKFGSVGDAVRRLQRALNAAVDARLPITGVYAGATTQALRAYQRLRGLAPNGVAADPTWDQLLHGRVQSVRGDGGKHMLPSSGVPPV